MTRKSFQPQFEAPILAGTKIHTIRATPKRLPKLGEEFVGFIWTGKAYRSPQREFFKSTVAKVLPLWFNGVTILLEDPRTALLLLPPGSEERIAKQDGFENLRAMADWFRKHHGLPFTGILIEWAQPVTPLGALGVLAVQPAAESRP
jgi:hypothetical protein